MTRNDQSESLHELDGVMRQTVKGIRDRKPPGSRVTQTLHSIGRTIAQWESPVPPRQSTSVFTSLRWVAAVAGTLLLAVLVVTSVNRPALSLDEVARTIASQPWVQVVETEENGGLMETWFSPLNDISARRTATAMEFRNHKSKVAHWYQVKDGKLIRFLEDGPRRLDSMAGIPALFPILLAGAEPNDATPLIQWLAAHREGVELVSQSVSRGIQKKDLLMYTLKLQHKGQVAEFMFEVDVNSKLPARCTITGGPKQRTVFFDYPAQGPADIFQLGVPRDVPLVDRVPSDDVPSLLAEIYSVWDRFDDYQGIAVQGTDAHLIHRKGDRIRLDRLKLRSPLPPQDGDLQQWWTTDADVVSSELIVIRHGRSEWGRTAGSQKLQRGKHELELPRHWDYLPEFKCRPPMGAPSLNLQIKIVEKPTEGPAGSVLLLTNNASSYNTAPTTPRGEPAKPLGARKYWIDRDRGLVVQWGGRLAEDFAQSPNGFWYPTTITRTVTIHGEGEKGDGERTVAWRCYLNFDAQLPDSLFDTNNPGPLDLP